MRKIIFIFIINILFFRQSCSGQTTDKENLYKYPLKTIYSFCQHDTNKVIFFSTLRYDKENRLIQLSNFYDTIERTRVVFNYNKLGLLESKEFYSFKEEMAFERKRVFEYDKNLKLISEYFDDEKGNNTKYNYTYNLNGQMVIREEKCNYNILKYSYEYNEQGKLVKMYRNDEPETSYEYSKDLLTKETNYRNNDEVTFEYNDKGLLLIKKENNKIIEKNIYKNELLVKRWTYYFGIDPCFEVPCCSQYFTKYEYY